MDLGGRGRRFWKSSISKSPPFLFWNVTIPFVYCVCVCDTIKTVLSFLEGKVYTQVLLTAKPIKASQVRKKWTWLLEHNFNSKSNHIKISITLGVGGGGYTDLPCVLSHLPIHPLDGGSKEESISGILHEIYGIVITGVTPRKKTSMIHTYPETSLLLDKPWQLIYFDFTLEVCRIILVLFE